MKHRTKAGNVKEKVFQNVSRESKIRQNAQKLVLQQNTWIDDRKFLESRMRASAAQDNINHPAYGTWTADFMLRQNESRAFLEKPSI